MSGKGDDRRPLIVDEKTFSDNWDRVFGGKTRFTEFKVEDYLDSPEAVAAYEAELALEARQDYYASVRSQNYADSLRLEGFSGLPERSIGLGSNPSSDLAVATVGSNPTAAAIYVDDCTGA